MKHLFFICICLLVQFNICGQSFTPGLPEKAGMSGKKLEMIDDLTQQYLNEEKFPGGVILVARRGTIVYHKSFGYRTPEKNAPYRNNDIFRIASMSKAITTVAIMQLYERGLIELDDPLMKYIPAFRNSSVLDSVNTADSTYTTVPVKKPVTLRHLLTHTSGITYGNYLNKEAGFIFNKLGLQSVGIYNKHRSTEEFIDLLAQAPLAFQPGERYNYGLNMDVLGRVVEVVSRKSLDVYLKENIFDPLKMTDTWFFLPPAKKDRMVPLYAHDDKDHLYITSVFGSEVPSDFPVIQQKGCYNGGGGLSSTAMDYARFSQALLNGGILEGERILSRRSVALMTSDQMITLNQKGNGYSQIPGFTYCLGFSLITPDAAGMCMKSPGTFEWGGAFGTKFFIDPAENLVFIGMVNIMPYHHSYFWNRITALVYGAITD